MGADPVAHKNAVCKGADGAIVNTKSNAPLSAANLLEVRRGMERKPAPDLIVLSGKNADLYRQAAVKIPEFRGSLAW